MALEAQALGGDCVWLPDHVLNAHMEKRMPILENWTLLPALGVPTEKAKPAGPRVNNFPRHPAVCAKTAATRDVITGRIAQPFSLLEGMGHIAAAILPTVA